MTGLIETSITNLDKQYKEVLKLVDNKSYENLDRQTMDKLFNVLSDRELQKFYERIRDPKYFQNMDYEDLGFLHSTLSKINAAVERVKKEYDINMFLKNGYLLDEAALTRTYNKSRVLRKRHPNFKVKRLIELYVNPPKTLKTYHNKEEILISKYVFRKYIIAMVQMIYNHMDLVVVLTGGEGTGKSTKVSQDMYILYWFLTEVGIIDYKFDIKEMFFNTLYKLREAEDKYFDNPFRIMALDEGNELNRQDWKDEEVKTFFQRLRRERYNQRIKFICIPVLGEMMTNIVLARVNFVFEMGIKNNIQSGTLKKGAVKMYIIPRGDQIYSPEQRREISKDEIKKTLFDNLEGKKYLTGIPKSMLIKKFSANGVWGFPEEQYNENLKEANKTFTVSKGITFSDHETFAFYKSRVTARTLGIKPKDPRYRQMASIISKINKHWENDQSKFEKFESAWKRKFEDKEL